MRIQKTPQVVFNKTVLRNLWILAILVSSCYRQAPIQDPLENATQERPAPDPALSPASDSSQDQPTLDVEQPGHFDDWAQTVLSEMTLREKVAQLMMPWILGDFSPEGSDDHDRVVGMIDSFGIGGVIVSVGSRVR
jgi:hypothetical protein